MENDESFKPSDAKWSLLPSFLCHGVCLSVCLPALLTAGPFYYIRAHSTLHILAFK